MSKELWNIAKKFNKKTVLLIGDFMIDRYIQGSCSRIAPEASAPVVDVHEKQICLGGAANVAVNLSALGAKVLFCTVTGNDDTLKKAKPLLERYKIDSKHFVSVDNRETIIKTRVLSESQLIVRFDEGSENPIDQAAETALIESITQAYASCDAVLIADYNKGTITQKVISKLEELQKSNKKLLAIDAKSYQKYKILNPDLIKPNYQEALKIVNEKPARDRKSQVRAWGKLLFEESGAKNTLLTMDRDGVAFFHQSEFMMHHEVEKVANPQVSGAGDSFISSCFLAMAIGAKMADAIAIGAHTAHVAIQDKKTAMCSMADLEEKLMEHAKNLPLNHLSKLVAKLRLQGKRIVFTNGCFDILHCGHVKYLTKAKEKGDVLIVGVNNDESIKRLKGFTRPINGLQERIEVLSGLACIDYVVTFGKPEDDTPINLIKALKPHVFVKGGDYSYKYLPEKFIIDKIGCQLEFIPFVDNKSTTNTIKKIQDNLRVNAYLS